VQIASTFRQLKVQLAIFSKSVYKNLVARLNGPYLNFSFICWRSDLKRPIYFRCYDISPKQNWAKWKMAKQILAELVVT